MNGDNWPLVTDELVEFEKHPAEVQDIMKITDYMKSMEYTLNQ